MISRSFLRSSRFLAAQSGRAPSISLLSPSHRLSSRLPAPVRAQIATRWYSDAKPEAAEGEKKGTASEAAKEEEDPVKKELEAKKKEVVTLKDQYLRSVADYRNLQDRSKRDQDNARQFAIQKFAKDLIESIDNLDLALANVPKEALEAPDDANKELKQLHGGLKMTERILMNTLKKHGLEKFDPSEAGEKFDPNLHEATFQTPQADKEDGTCFYTTQKGFTLNGRVVRAAKVGVVKNS